MRTPEEGLIQWRVRGSSMRPLLREGDTVAVSPTAAFDVGDVVLVSRSSGDGFLLHRVVGLLPGFLRTAGDNTAAEDAPASPEEVVGKMVAFRRGDGRWMKERPGAKKVIRLFYKKNPSFCKTALRRLNQLGAARCVGPELNSVKESVKMEKIDRFEVQEIGKEFAVFDSDTGAVHFLNKTAFLVWKELQAGVDMETLIETLGARYSGVGVDNLRSDAVEIRQTLVESNLLES